MAPFLDSRWYTSTNVAALYAAAGAPPATTPAQDLVDTWASGGAGSDGFAMVFEDAGGTDAPSIYVKDSGTPANDTDINLTDDWDAFNSFLTYTSPSPKIVRQSDGNLKYCAHNLYLNSASPANQSITVVSGQSYAVTITGSVSVTASGAATGTWTAGTNTFTAATTTLTLGSTSGSGTVHVYRTPADTTYLATTGSIRYALPIQHDNSNNAEGLLVEPASTNLTPDSVITNANFTLLNAAVGADNDAVSPSGATDAFKLADNNAGGTQSPYMYNDTRPTFSTNTQYCWSVYAKADGVDYLGMRMISYNGIGVQTNFFNLTTGSVGTTNADIDSASIQDVGGGWYRCIIVFTTDASSVGNGTLRYHVCQADNDLNVDSDGTSSIHLWHEQIELGSVPTSPIITTGATATRAVDDLSKALTAIEHSATAGTLYAKYVPRGVATSRDIVRLDDGTANEVISIGQTSGAAARLTVTDGGAAQTAPLTSGTVVAAADNNVAASWAANDFAISEGGAAASTDTSGTLPTVTTFDVGAVNGLVKEVLHLPETMSDGDLASITT